MKKVIKLIPVLFIFLLSTLYLPLSRKKADTLPTEKTEEFTQKDNQIILTLDFSEGEISTLSPISAKTAFEALEKAAQINSFDIKTKTYDFGIFIETINGKTNTKEKSWMFYVNGNLADKAADKFELKNEDQVLFKYEKPVF